MWKNNISFKKETEKIVLLQVIWKAWYKLLSSSGLKKIFVHVSIIDTKHKHLECGGMGHPQNIVHQMLHSSNSKKERIDSSYFSEGKQIGMFYK